MAGSNKPTWYKWFAIICLYVTVYMVVAGEKYLVRTVQEEARLNQTFYSDEASQRAEQRGTRWFKSMFIETGVMAHSFDMFIPSEEAKAKSKGTEGLGDSLFAWVEGRIRAFWTIVWSTYTRLSTLMLWLPYLPLILIPFFVDGWAQRERRKHTFEFSSPVKYGYAMIAIGFLPLAFIAVVTAPFVLHPAVAPLMLFSMGLILRTATENFMKRA